jgi:hypothetical protein
MKTSSLSCRLVLFCVVIFALFTLPTWAQTKPASSATSAQCNLNASQIEIIATLARYKLKAPVRNVEYARNLTNNSAAQDTAYTMCNPYGLVPGKITLAVLMPSLKVERDEFALDMVVMVVNEDFTNALYLVLPGFANSDSIRLTGVELDTVPYKLAADKPGFGVWQKLNGSSSANPYEARALSLFAVSNNTLKRVLDNVDTALNKGEWDTNCNGQFENTKRIIQISEKSTNGFADLIIKQNRTTQIARAIKTAKGGSDCNETSTKLPLKVFSLKFNGDKYKLPKDMD